MERVDVWWSSAAERHSETDLSLNVVLTPHQYSSALTCWTQCVAHRCGQVLPHSSSTVNNTQLRCILWLISKNQSESSQLRSHRTESRKWILESRWQDLTSCSKTEQCWVDKSAQIIRGHDFNPLCFHTPKSEDRNREIVLTFFSLKWLTFKFGLFFNSSFWLFFRWWFSGGG